MRKHIPRSMKKYGVSRTSLLEYASVFARDVLASGVTSDFVYSIGCIPYHMNDVNSCKLPVILLKKQFNIG